jgi:hypothetical protein
MKKILVLAALLVGACAFDTMNAELPKYVGQPVSSLVDRLGYPSGEQSIMGRKVYVWRTDMDYVSTTPVTSTSTGYVNYKPVTLTSTSYVSTPMHLACKIRAVVNPDDRIYSVDYEGNNGACLRYSSRLKTSNAASDTKVSAEFEVINCRRIRDGSTTPEVEPLSRQTCRRYGGTEVGKP